MIGLYLITGAVTFLTGLLGFLLWRKTASLNFVFGAAALYFWSIHGAWALNYDKTIGSEFLRYHYLEARLFTINLDESYFMSVMILGLFCIGTLVTALVLSDNRRTPTVLNQKNKIELSHAVVIAISLVSAILAYLVIRTAFTQAVVLGQTGYSAIASESIRFFTVHQLFNRLALFSALIGFAVCFSGENNRYFKTKNRRFFLVIYSSLILALIAYVLLLGNKNELFTGVVMGLLFFLGTHKRPPIRGVAALGVAMLLVVGSVDYLRNFALLSGETNDIEATQLLAESSRIIFSNEAVSAHMSMYGALKYDIPLSMGNGLNALVFSIIPSALWADRPSGNYLYYAQNVGAETGLGYTIHHATSWYLDFGILGVALGAIMLGSIWTTLHNGFARLHENSGTAALLFYIVAPFGFTAYFPVILRAGVEVYKGALVGAVILPLIMLIAAWMVGRWFVPVHQESSASTA